MNKVLREEKKFLLRTDQYMHLSHLLSQCITQDPHNGPDGYAVRSLYFDSIQDRDFYEKTAGAELRRKIRLRIYSPDSPFALLEMKQKQGAMQLKRSLMLSRQEALQLIDGRTDVLLKRPEPFAAECFAMMQMHCYRPKAIVEYRRKAFIARENNIRITFDRRITATESSLDLFSPTLSLSPVMDLSQVVMEVKYNGFLLDYIKRLINPADKPEISVSKYVLARSHSCLSHL